MNCSSCGTTNPEGSRFCMTCGSAIVDAPAEMNPEVHESGESGEGTGSGQERQQPPLPSWTETSAPAEAVVSSTPEASRAEPWMPLDNSADPSPDTENITFARLDDVAPPEVGDADDGSDEMGSEASGHETPGSMYPDEAPAADPIAGLPNSSSSVGTSPAGDAASGSAPLDPQTAAAGPSKWSDPVATPWSGTAGTEEMLTPDTHDPVMASDSPSQPVGAAGAAPGSDPGASAAPTPVAFNPADPFGLYIAASQLSQEARTATRTALVVTAALLAPGERVERVAAGSLGGIPAIVALTDQRILAVNQQDWRPTVTWFGVDGQLNVQAWEDEHGATIVLTAGPNSVTIDGVTDRQPSYELVAAVKARTGQH